MSLRGSSRTSGDSGGLCPSPTESDSDNEPILKHCRAAGSKGESLFSYILPKLHGTK